MGVVGFNKLLAKHGWLPFHDSKNKKNNRRCCSTSLWRDDPALEVWNPENEQNTVCYASRIVPLLTNCTLHIDGNCLAFFLHRIAYARHVESIAGSCSTKVFRRRKTPVQQQQQQLQIRSLLPNLLPMKLLAQVTTELVVSLQHHCKKIIVYWDGELRHVYKEETDLQRQQRRPEEWSALQHFCDSGTVPVVSALCELEYEFPKSRLFSTQVMHTLLAMQIHNVFCDLEADPVIAKAATNQHDHYVIGLDSDFCFFPNINYVPVTSLRADASDKNLTGCVIRRETLAPSLGIPEELMVELAILMGNDYIDVNQEILDQKNERTESILEFLHKQQAYFRVTSPSENTEEKLRFIRMLYNLEDLEEFSILGQGDDLEEGDKDSCEQASEKEPSVRPKIPSEVDLSLLELQVMHDSSIKDAVVRCLQAYIDYCTISEAFLMIHQEHLLTFKNMNVHESPPFLNEPTWRPTWTDVLAAYMIEKMISRATFINRKSLLGRVTPPFAMFDALKFFALLALKRSTAPAANKETRAAERSAPEPAEKVDLPIDEHEERILEEIANNRITIIQGETGCGKSSRIPVMLLNSRPPDRAIKQIKLFISQPRRIAAKALVERLRASEPTLRDDVALRMGHGVREYETRGTRAWVVTTGYLVRLLANHLEQFDVVSHLIIDEVHERSVDTDVLCLLCKRLLQSNPHIRLILMSATLAATLYQNYFRVDRPPIQVGARRFPVDEVYLDDFERKLKLPEKQLNRALEISKHYTSMKRLLPPTMHLLEKLYDLVAGVATAVGRPGSSVLVFVPGMNDIIAITEKLEQIYVAGVRFTAFPIHSDIPFEDQMNVFRPAEADEVKVIIATNAAESSVTLPDVDHVICLGLCKQIIYNAASHRQMLVPTWISRASATQRAGRTGRLRPGTVYRFYTREMYEKRMEAFECGEMQRIPLDSVVLMLKEMLPCEQVTNLLLDSLEPPNVSAIDRSFVSLHAQKFLSAPTEESDITVLGKFVTHLGIDLALGSVVGLGIQFGVGAEAIELAGTLSFPMSPWVISNPLIHKPEEFNEKVVKTFTSKCDFDGGLCSDPLATMNMLWDFHKVSNRVQWCWKNGLHQQRVTRLASSCKNLRFRVAQFLDIHPDVLKVQQPPRNAHHAVITILRVIQAWVFHDSVIECNPAKFVKGMSTDGVMIELKSESDVVTEKHLEQVLSRDRHPFSLIDNVTFERRGEFTHVGDSSVGSPQHIEKVEERLMSFMAENQFHVAALYLDTVVCIYSTEEVLGKISGNSDCQQLGNLTKSGPIYVSMCNSEKAHGIEERPCGKWRISGKSRDSKTFLRFSTASDVQTRKRPSKKASKTAAAARRLSSVISSDNLIKSLTISLDDSDGRGSKVKFSILSKGEGVQLGDRDIADLLVTSHSLCTFTRGETKHSQSVFFKFTGKADSVPSLTTSPLIRCTPEGSRLLSVLASEQRRLNVVRFRKELNGKEDTESNYLEIYPSPVQTFVQDRWRRCDSTSKVYVGCNSAAASALPAARIPSVIYGCCANSLEIRGGALKVDGLTLLPPGYLFFSLCKLSFGIAECYDIEDIRRYFEGLQCKFGHEVEEWHMDRFSLAFELNESSKQLGEELICFQKNTLLLLELFDHVDGRTLTNWPTLKSNPLLPENLTKFRSLRKSMEMQAAKKVNNSFDQHESEEINSILAASSAFCNPEKGVTSSPTCQESNESGSFSHLVLTPIAVPEELEKHLFATTFAQTVGAGYLPIANIMSLIISHSYGESKGKTIMSFDSGHWKLSTLEIGGISFYIATFTFQCDVKPVNRSNVAAWIAGGLSRPATIEDARNCLPQSSVDCAVLWERAKIVPIDNNYWVVLDSAEAAVTMEAAFWLERRFGSVAKHWFEQDLKLLIAKNRSENSPVKQKKKRKKRRNAK